MQEFILRNAKIFSEWTVAKEDYGKGLKKIMILLWLGRCWTYLSKAVEKVE